MPRFGERAHPGEEAEDAEPRVARAQAGAARAGGAARGDREAHAARALLEGGGEG